MRYTFGAGIRVVWCWLSTSRSTSTSWHDVEGARLFRLIVFFILNCNLETVLFWFFFEILWLRIATPATMRTPNNIRNAPTPTVMTIYKSTPYSSNNKWMNQMQTQLVPIHECLWFFGGDDFRDNNGFTASLESDTTGGNTYWMEIPSESVDQSHPLALSKSNQSANNLQLRIIDPTMTMTTN